MELEEPGAFGEPLVQVGVVRELLGVQGLPVEQRRGDLPVR